MSTSPSESPSQSFRVLSGVSRASIHWNIVGGNLNFQKKAHRCGLSSGSKVTPSRNPGAVTPLLATDRPLARTKSIPPPRISINPTHTLPGSRLNVPQPYRTGYHDFQIKVDQRLRKTSCASAYQRATAGSLRPSASARTRAPSGRPGAAISRWTRRCAATPRGARLNWGHSSIRKTLYA